jgi:hypothetical protein
MRKKFSIRFTVAGDEDKLLEIMTSPRAFKHHYAQYLFRHPVTGKVDDPITLARTFDHTVTYIAYHPTFRPINRGISHSQITDHAFEDRAIRAVEHHLMATYVVSRWHAVSLSERDQGWQHLTGEQDIAEWNGIWRRDDGHMFFLETKHVMTMVNVELNFFLIEITHEHLQAKLNDVRKKLNRSVDFLKTPHSSASVFVAGNHWLEDDTMLVAKELYGFGVVHGNEQDLNVEDPGMC